MLYTLHQAKRRHPSELSGHPIRQITWFVRPLEPLGITPLSHQASLCPYRHCAIRHSTCSSSTSLDLFVKYSLDVTIRQVFRHSKPSGSGIPSHQDQVSQVIRIRPFKSSAVRHHTSWVVRPFEPSSTPRVIVHCDHLTHLTFRSLGRTSGSAHQNSQGFWLLLESNSALPVCVNSFDHLTI